MKPEKKTDIKISTVEDEDMPVYEGEIIDEEKEETAIVPNTDTPLVEKPAYKLGKAAGSIIAVIGFFNEIRNMFRTKNTNGTGMGKAGGRGMRRKKRRMRRIK